MSGEKGKLKLVMGGSGYGKTSYVLDKTIEKSLVSEQKDYIFIVPEQFTMETQKAIVERHPRNGVMNIDIVSFNRLAFRIFEELGINTLSILDDTGKTLILKSVVEANKEKLGIYKKKASQAGFIEQMKSAISELYSYGVEPEDIDGIKTRLAGMNYVCGKLSDIQLIYREFKKTISEKYITKEEILKKLCDVAGKSKIISNSEFILDGFTGFTPIQYNVIDRLLKEDRKLTITVTLPEEELSEITAMGFENIQEQELFNMSKVTVNKLISIAADNNIMVGKNDIIVMPANKNFRHQNVKEMAEFEKLLFRESDKKIDNNGAVKIWREYRPKDEVERTAACINYMVREKGYRYRDFAVITGEPDAYRDILINVFEKNNIPLFMDNKRKLILNPCVVALRAAIAVVMNNFCYEDVFAFLKSNVTILEREETDAFENYVLEYGIRGKKQYFNEFKKCKRKKEENNLALVNDIRRMFTEQIEEFCNAIDKKSATVREYCEAVYGLMEKLSLYDILKEYEKQFTEEGNPVLAKEYSQTYGQIIGLLDKLVELLGDTDISLKEYAGLLDAGFEEIKVGVIPLGIDTVVAGDIQRTRLNNIKVLFVLGANDGIIPSVGKGKRLLNEKDRGALKKADLELSPTNRENIFIQRFYLYQNLTKPSERLIITYASTGSDGKLLRRSYLIGNILKLMKNRDAVLKKTEQINIYTKELGVSYLAEGFGKTADSLTGLKKELFSYLSKDKELEKKVKKIIEGAYFKAESTKIDSAVAKILYGEDIIKSASRLEKYAACGYAHFLQYGLKLAERKIFEINAADIGTIYHRIIEMFSVEMKKRHETFRSINEEIREEILDECMQELRESVAGDVFFSTRRNEYLLKRIRDVSSKTIWAISEHIKAGKFEPEEFEMKFSDGRVDRVDTYTEGDNIYVKIIDYKSGSRQFEMDDVLNGLQLQLIYYMDNVSDVKQRQNQDKNIIPAGAFYFNIKSPYVERIYKEISQGSSEADEELKKEIRKSLLEKYGMTGIVNSDEAVVFNMDEALQEEKGESVIIPIKEKEINIGIGKNALSSKNFTQMLEYVRNKIDTMCDEIIDGKIETNPYIKGQSTACTYCSYNGVCNFNEKHSGNKFRTLGKYSAEDILKMLGGGKNDDKMD